jgi:hypothetical protein
MIKMVIIFLFFAFSFVEVSIAQEIIPGPTTSADNGENNSVLKVNKQARNSTVTVKIENSQDNSDILLHQYTNSFLYNKNKPEVFHSPNIISSFRSNVNFGGMWGGYAIINFTPQMNIKPFDFISIYANHSSSMFIPISEVKSYVKSLAIKGAAVLAIDNSLKFLIPANQLLQSVIGFTLKNVAIGLLEKSLNKPGQTIEFKYYYYSINIRF